MDFDDIRPYYDAEYQEVMQQLLQKEAFVGALTNYFPEIGMEQLQQILLSCRSIKDFQQRIIASVVGKIVASSVTELTFEGFDNLDREQPTLFMSNHRDIVLDSAFLNYGLNKEGFNTCEIAIGSNLLGVDWVKDLVRINKSFIVKRNIPKQEILEASKKLSAYINFTLHEKKESIWIAQREGRAKDGNDNTNPGLLKMFGLGIDKNLLEHLISLNITPVSISYEYDPCDYLKLPELLAKSKGESYNKQAGEDMQHMLLGIQGFKGRVQLNFGKPISRDLASLRSIKNRNEQLRAVAGMIDKQIHQNYKLWPNNYISADLLQTNALFSDRYTPQEKDQFQEYLKKRLAAFSGQEKARSLFLEMYANPVFNALGSI